MSKHKFLIAATNGGSMRLIDRQTSINDRVVKLKADKHDQTWAADWRGRELGRIVDDGNGLTWTTAYGQEFRFRYDVAAELLLLLEHLDESGNYFC